MRMHLGASHATPDMPCWPEGHKPAIWLPRQRRGLAGASQVERLSTSAAALPFEGLHQSDQGADGPVNCEPATGLDPDIA
jgi:hypothetical protein